MKDTKKLMITGVILALIYNIGMRDSDSDQYRYTCAAAIWGHSLPHRPRSRGWDAFQGRDGMEALGAGGGRKADEYDT